MLHQHRSSKRPVAFLTALVLGLVAAASAQYVEPTFYGTPTYYYEPAPAYYAPESVPVYYSPEFVAPAPYYYIPAAPTTPYGETVAPTPYYYAPPVAPTPYGTPSPVAPAPYYYITPSTPTTPYGTPAAPAPYYYLTPSAPTSPYGTPAAPAPYYYLTPSAPTTPYGTPAAPAPYYYLTPSAPTTPYGTPVAPTPYYYIPPVAPTTPYGPGPAAPTYYYTAPAPVTPYGNPVAPTYYYVAPPPVAPTPYAAPSTCPPCPTCEATSSYTTTPVSKMAISTPAATTASTEGTCYCPYDADWATWAIGDSSCRSTLYSKCKTDARLSCSWLDSYFDSNSTHRDDFTRDNEANIEAFLYNDCPPAAPCACAALEFTAKDSPASTFQCCKALKIYAKVPFSGLVSKDVDAYCEAGSIKAATRVAGWVKHALWHADCSVASTSVYSFKKAGDATATSMAASEGAALPKSRAAESDKRSTVLAAVFGAVGGAGLAAAAVAGWIAYKKSNSRYSMV